MTNLGRNRYHIFHVFLQTLFRHLLVCIPLFVWHLLGSIQRDPTFPIVGSSILFGPPWTSTVAWIFWISGFLNCWNAVANCSSTLAYADFNIYGFQKTPLFWVNWLNVSSNVWGEWWKSFYWLTQWEHYHNTSTALISISLKAMSCAVF
jgi:hypothetical protein